jgi:hypothetical protein
MKQSLFGKYSMALLSWLSARTIACVSYSRSVEFRRIIRAMQLSEGTSMLSVGCGNKDEENELH